MPTGGADPTECSYWITLTGPRKPNEFYEIYPALAGLNFCDPAMRNLQSSCQFPLGNSSVFAQSL